jgi:hypothetical protein
MKIDLLLLRGLPLVLDQAGSRPGGRGTFLCFAKEKYPKERRPAVWVPSLRYGQPALLDYGGGPQNSLRSNNCGPDPASICAARPSQDGFGTKKSESGSRTRTARSAEFGCWYFFPTPSGCAEERRARRIRARDCLSHRRVRARPRLDRAPQGARSAAKGRRQQGRLFFGYFLLAKQKKVTSRRAPPGLVVKAPRRNTTESTT